MRPWPMVALGLDAPAPMPPPGLLVPELALSHRPEEVKAALAGAFWRADRGRLASFFTDDDLAAAKREIAADGANLSHGLRRTAHAVSADLVLRIVEGSRTSGGTGGATVT